MEVLILIILIFQYTILASLSYNNPTGTENILDMHHNLIDNVHSLILNGTASLINASIVQCSATNVSGVNGSFVRLYVENLTVDPAWIDNCCSLNISVTQSCSLTYLNATSVSCQNSNSSKINASSACFVSCSIVYLDNCINTSVTNINNCLLNVSQNY